MLVSDCSSYNQKLLLVPTRERRTKRILTVSSFSWLDGIHTSNGVMLPLFFFLHYCARCYFRSYFFCFCCLFRKECSLHHANSECFFFLTNFFFLFIYRTISNKMGARESTHLKQTNKNVLMKSCIHDLINDHFKLCCNKCSGHTAGDQRCCCSVPTGSN